MFGSIAISCYCVFQLTKMITIITKYLNYWVNTIYNLIKEID